ncbi:MAG: signal peptidase I [Gemmatimonadota bacterium]
MGRSRTEARARSREASVRPRRDADAESRETRGRSGASNAIREWAKTIGGAIVLFLIIKTFLIQTFTITSGSMRNTLLVGDFLVVSKAAYGARVPLTDLRLPGYESLDRGEIVVFEGPHQPELDLVKRLVGLPGDTIAMRDGTLFLNGEPYDEPYVHAAEVDVDPAHPWMVWQTDHLMPGSVARDYEPTLDTWGPIVVPDDQYFMLGDNRDESFDSRYWGFVDRGLIKGRALFIYYSYDSEAFAPFPWITRVRWGRIGHTLE